MKEHPIIFISHMVSAILAGTKTQTRRIIKPQPQENDGHLLGKFWWKGSYGWDERQLIPHCPYGKVEDILWVRETWMESPNPEFGADYKDFRYKASVSKQFIDEWKGYWKPSIFMPKAACRIRLEITNIRVERLQDISEEDAMAEGITLPNYAEQAIKNVHYPEPSTIYSLLWKSINGKGSWDKNPWVWVIEFKVKEILK